MKKALRLFSKIWNEGPQDNLGNTSDGKEQKNNRESNATAPNDKNSVEATKTRTQNMGEAKNKIKQSSQTHSDTRGENTAINNRKLFLGGIPLDITETELKKVFEKYGKVTNVWIILDNEKKKPKGYGFLEFENESSAEACLTERFVTVNKKKVEVKKALPKSQLRGREKSQARGTEGIRDSGTVLADAGGRATMNERPLELSSSDSGTDSLLYQKLLEDYFKTKFTIQNLLQSNETSHNPSRQASEKEESDLEAALEMILNGFIVSKEQESSDTSSYFKDSDSTDDEVQSNYSKNSQTTGPSYTNKPRLQGKAHLTCDPCKWSSPCRSTEKSLNHFYTSSHKNTVKQRFKKENFSQVQTSANQENSQKRTKQSKTPPRRKTEDLPDKPPPENQKHQKTAYRKNQNTAKKKTILQESLSSMTAAYGKNIKCQLCNKVIPQSSDLATLMGNISHHLQGKKHLEKIKELEALKQP